MHSTKANRVRAYGSSIFALSLLLAGLTSCHSRESSPVIALSGAGSTFVYPVMGRWVEEFQRSHPNVHINYQSIGSGGGIQQVRAGTVDFGATDTPLTDRELATMPPVIQIPESSGPVCVTYNLDGLSKPLQLSPEALAGIFLGSITHWRDPILARDNPGQTLPDRAISVVHRADGSGTTDAFTAYLSSVSQTWAAKVGRGKSVSWPLGLGGKGSEGVTGQVKQSPGSIGYVELTYATQNKLPVAAIENQAGIYVLPSTAGATAAIAAFKNSLDSDPRAPIANPAASAPNAYPISTLTFLLIPKDGKDLRARTALQQFVTYVVTHGQDAAAGLNYAPLPESLKQQDLEKLKQMTANGKPLP